MRHLAIWTAVVSCLALGALIALPDGPPPAEEPVPAPVVVERATGAPSAPTVAVERPSDLEPVPGAPSPAGPPPCLIGTVADAAGTPISGARVTLVQRSAETSAPNPAHRLEMTSDGDGGFTIEQQLPAGVWHVYLDQRLGPASPETVTLDEGAGPLRLDVRTQELALRVRGRVVNPNGRGIPLVSITSATESFWPTQTTMDGTFEIWSRGPVDPTAEVRLDVSSGYFHPPEEAPAYAWGTEDATIDLQHRGTGDVEVVVTATGAPVERFVVQYAPDREDVGLLSARPSTGPMQSGGRHPEGKVRLRGLRGGRYLVLVVPNDRELVAMGPISAKVTAASTTVCRVELERAVGVPVEVVRADGSPVAAALVELVRKGDSADDAPIDARRRAVPVAESLLPGAFEALLRYAEARTDERGRAVLRCAPSDHPYTLRVTGPRHEPMVRTGVVVGHTPAPVRVVVSDHAALRIRYARPSTGKGDGASVQYPVPEWTSVTLYPTDGGWPPLHLGRGDAEVVGDAIRFGDIPAGSWRVRMRPAYRVGDAWQRCAFAVGMGIVVLGSGEVGELVLDPNEYRPAEVEFRVSLNGHTAVWHQLELVRRVAEDHVMRMPDGHVMRPGGGGFPPVRIDRRSRCALHDVQPGEYVAVLHAAGAKLSASAPIEIAPGVDLRDVHVEVEAPSMRLKIVDEGGAPVARRQVLVTAKDEPGHAEAMTDEDGIARFPLAPRGMLSVFLPPTEQERKRIPDCAVGRPPWREIEPVEVTARTGEVFFERTWPGF